MEVDFVLGGGSRMFECSDIRIFVGQANLNREVLLFFEDSIEPEPRPAASRTNVHDPVRSRILKRPPEARDNGFVEISKIEHELERVGSSVSKRLGEPGLVVNLDQLHPPQ